MTRLETKQELNREYRDIKYILTSGMRTKLLLSLYNIPKNLDDLRRDLTKPSATILHGLKELETINLVKKAHKCYELTSNGYLLTTNMIKLIENWYALGKSEHFWDDHDLSDLPEDVLKNVYLLKDANYINSTTSDLSLAFNHYINAISKSSELRIILPIYSENHFKHIIDLLNNGKLEKLELIISEEIFNSISCNKLFKENIHIYVIHFLCLLVDKKRERNIEAVCEEFNSLCNEYFNVLEGIVYSTKPLTKDQMTNIEKSIELKLNKKVELTNKLDSSLIGGLKVVVGDTVFDNSIQHKMEALKNELLQGKDVNS